MKSILLKMNIIDIPVDVILEIFKYLTAEELCMCAQVCNSWNAAAYHPSLWKKLYVPQWSKGSFRLEHGKSCKEEVLDMLPCYDFHPSIQKSEDTTHEFQIIQSVIQILPVIGNGIQQLCLSNFCSLTDDTLRAVLINCPHLKLLDLSYTKITGYAFKGLNEQKVCPHFLWLSFTGCSHLVDEGISSLVECWKNCDKRKDSVKENFGLKSLSLSGCEKLTSRTISELASVPEFFQNITYLDFSGCYNFTSNSLHKFIKLCRKLQPECLFYCHNINGPYPLEANGCNNLQSADRRCCTYAEF